MASNGEAKSRRARKYEALAAYGTVLRRYYGPQHRRHRRIRSEAILFEQLQAVAAARGLQWTIGQIAQVLRGIGGDDLMRRKARALWEMEDGRRSAAPITTFVKDRELIAMPDVMRRDLGFGPRARLRDRR